MTQRPDPEGKIDPFLTGFSQSAQTQSTPRLGVFDVDF
jgi:hypothetical protein